MANGGVRKTTYELLREMYSAEQLVAMDKVRARMQEDPTALDNRHAEPVVEETV